MKKSRFLLSLSALLMAVTLLLSLAACKKNDPEFPEEPDEPPAHTNNEVESYFYGYSRKHQQLFRYEFNLAGRPLGAVAVDWYTLEPCQNLQGSANDYRYTYDHNGRLVGHELGGAPLSIEYDEVGNPVRSVGFSRNGSIVTVEYTCGEQGDILSERVTKHAPTVAPAASQITVYTYDEDGRLIGENDYAYTYDKDTILFDVWYDGSVRPATVTLGENGEILSFQLSMKEPFRYDWTYDEDGRCISSRGRTLQDTLFMTAECQTVRDENGRLIEANVDRESPLQGANVEDLRYCLTYDEAGQVAQSIIYDLKDGRYTQCLTCNFVDGMKKSYSQDSYVTDASGNEKIIRDSVTEYDPVTGKSLKTSSYRQDMLQAEWISEYDELGRLVGSDYNEYSAGKLYETKRTEYKYGEKEDVIKKTTTTTYTASNSWETTIYEYENGVTVRALGENETTWGGKRIHSFYDKQMDPQTGTAVHTIAKVSEDGVLTEEEETTIDYLSEHSWTKILDRTLYTDGKVSLKVHSQELDDGRVVTQEKQYENDILILDKTTRKEPGIWTNGEWIQQTRPRSETFVYYEKDGSFDRREEWEYSYHDNGYRFESLCQTYDEDNKLLHYKMEIYDEKGNLTDVATS